MNQRVSLCLSCGLVVAAQIVAAQAPSVDWPQFRGAQGSGVCKTPVPVTLNQQNLVWKAPLIGAGASSPIVAGTRVYLTSYSGYAVPEENRGSLADLKRQLHCLDRQTGRTLWTREVPAKQPEEATIRDHGYAASTPAADSERVYVFFGKSGVFAFDHDGRQVWQADVGGSTHGWGSAASPVLWEKLLFVNAGVESESLIALEASTGKEVWRAGGIRESWNTPIVVSSRDGRTELLVAIFGKVLGFEPKTGAPLWSCATDIGWYMVPSLVSQNDIVYCIGGRTGGALAVRTGGQGDVTPTHRVWTGRKGSNVSSPILHDGYLYWAHENLGIAYCAEAASGRLVYEERMERAGQIYASPVLAGNTIYYLTRNGRVIALPARPTFEPPTVSDLGDGSQFNASPAVAGGRMFIRSDRFAYCFGDR